MTNLGADAHLAAQLGNGNPVQAARAQSLRRRLGIRPHRDAMAGIVDLNDVERIRRRDAEALALPDGEVVNAAMMADDLA